MNVLQPFSDPLDGVTFVEASAGTGKTYAIEMLYLRLLVERALRPEQIVVVTYTNAAAGELRDRIRTRVQAAAEWLAGDGEGGEDDEDWTRFLAGRRGDGETRRRLLEAQYGFDRAAISTIHGFCQRVLQEHAFDSGAAFGVEMIADQSALVDEVVRDFVAATLHEAGPAELEEVWGHKAFATMTRFAAQVAAQPDVAVVPMPSAIDSAETEWREVFTRARSAWQRDAEQILALSVGNKAIDKRGLPKRPQLEQGLAEVFASDEPPARARYGKLDRIGAGYLTGKTKDGFDPPRHEFFDLCDRLIEIESLLASGARTRYFGELAEFARREIPLRKQRRGTVYFDDLLLNLRDALRGSGGSALADKLRRRFRAALIDEFQDTDPIQYEIFEKIFVGDDRPLFLIGDPKQSIYSFRGADIHTYVAAGQGAARKSLATNWRSSERAVAAVNQLFRRPGVFVMDQITFSDVNACGEKPELTGGDTSGVRFLWCDPPDSGENAPDYVRKVRRGVASRIVELLASGQRIGDDPVRPGHIAVLCRKNDQASDLQDELRRRGVPTVLTGDRSVFETAEALDLIRVLNALVDPRDAGAMRSALCTPLCGMSGDALVGLRDDESGWQLWSERFRHWRRRWDEDGFMAAFGTLRDDCKSAAKLLAHRGGERRLTNYLHLAELLQVASRELRSGPQGLLEWLRLMSSDGNARGELAAESVQVRLESDADAVVLTTIHKSKGLEYPIVFLPFLWGEPRRIDSSLVGYVDESERRSIWVGAGLPDPVKASATEERDAEDMRLVYVALTRAQQSTFVVAPPYKRGAESPLACLLGGLQKERIDQLVADSDGAIGVESLRVTNERRPPEEAVGQLVPPGEIESIPADWRVSSFSGLTHGADSLTPQAEEGRDADDVDTSLPGDTPASPGEAVRLADLDTGTRVGLMIHSVFEDLDFRTEDSEEIRELVARKAESYRAGVAHVDALSEAIAGILKAPLREESAELTLAEIDKSRRLDELEFIFPVTPDRGSRVTPRRLAAVIGAHGAPVHDPRYAERVGALGFGPFSGFLRGYIDMVFEHGGRWYVVDYKSNFLGRTRDAYRQPGMIAAMRQHDYYLQYLLYVVATHRYLTRRLREYSYEQHFGGVFYLFLRGMAPESPGTGVYYDRPGAELVRDLSALFDHGGEGGA